MFELIKVMKCFHNEARPSFVDYSLKCMVCANYNTVYTKKLFKNWKYFPCIENNYTIMQELCLLFKE